MSGLEAGLASQATLDMLSAKVKSQEDIIAQKEEEIRKLNTRIQESENQQIKLSKLFEEKYQEIA